MFRTPVSIRDLYFISLVLALVLVVFTLLTTTNIFVILAVFFIPHIFITLRLIFATRPYSEQSLTTLNPQLYRSFLGVSILLILLSRLFADSVFTSVYFTIVLVITTLPLFSLHLFFGKPYEKIEFGFRSSLPESNLWKSGTIYVNKARNTENWLAKYVYYWIASQRFQLLTEKLNHKIPYSNHQIASRYFSVTSKLAEKYSPFSDTIPNVSEAALDSILADFTRQECANCKREKPVGEMYVLTDGGQISEIYCESCVDPTSQSYVQDDSEEYEEEHSSTETTTTESETTDSKEQTSPFKQKQDRVQHAASVFGLHLDEIKTLSSKNLDNKYRSLVQSHHPDVGGDTEKFREIVDAYETLKTEIE